MKDNPARPCCQPATATTQPPQPQPQLAQPSPAAAQPSPTPRCSHNHPARRKTTPCAPVASPPRYAKRALASSPSPTPVPPLEVLEAEPLFIKGFVTFGERKHAGMANLQESADSSVTPISVGSPCNAIRKKGIVPIRTVFQGLHKAFSGSSSSASLRFDDGQVRKMESRLCWKRESFSKADLYFQELLDKPRFTVQFPVKMTERFRGEKAIRLQVQDCHSGEEVQLLFQPIFHRLWIKLMKTKAVVYNLNGGRFRGKRCRLNYVIKVAGLIKLWCEGFKVEGWFDVSNIKLYLDTEERKMVVEVISLWQIVLDMPLPSGCWRILPLDDIWNVFENLINGKWESSNAVSHLQWVRMGKFNELTLEFLGNNDDYLFLLRSGRHPLCFEQFPKLTVYSPCNFSDKLAKIEMNYCSFLTVKDVCSFIESIFVNLTNLLDKTERVVARYGVNVMKVRKMLLTAIGTVRRIEEGIFLVSTVEVLEITVFQVKKERELGLRILEIWGRTVDCFYPEAVLLDASVMTLWLLFEMISDSVWTIEGFQVDDPYA